jgi:hypothetical protein
MLRITKDFNLDAFETFLEQLNRTEADVLVLPSNPPRYRGAFGAEAALVQLAISWSRSRRARALRVYSRAESEEPLGTLGAEAHGIVALSLAPKIVDFDGQPIPRSKALAPSAPWVEAMDSAGRGIRNSSKGSGVNLICVKGAQREYLFPLYSDRSPKAIRPRSAYMSLLEGIFRDIVPPADQGLFVPAHARALGEMCWELISNTDDHATTDVHRNQYLRNVRGLMASYSNVDANFVTTIAPDRPEIVEYFRSRAHRTDVRESIKVFELSVFDAGPGLARRQLGRDFSEMSLDVELNATKQCFKLGATTKDSMSSGVGLFSVWRLLRSVKGFIRIRTGRHALFRTFSGSEADDDFELWSWYRDARILAPAEGTLITIIIPTRE